MHEYEYVGPVMIFNRCVANKWRGRTMAVSSTKAKSNLTFQYKKSNGLAATARVSLPGKIKEL